MTGGFPMKEKVLTNKKNGMLVLLLTIILYVVAASGVLVWAISPPLYLLCVAYLCLGWLVAPGLKVLGPQEALVLTLFGKYIGTLKGAGFYFVNPFCSAVNPAAHTVLGQSSDVKGKTANKESGRRVSLKIMTLNNSRQKINDCLGNPVEIGIAVTWRVVDLLEVVCDKKNVLEDLLLQLRERDVRIIPLDTNCFIRELKSGISFLIQGAMVGIHEDGQLVRIVLYFRNVLEERTQKHLLNIALSRTQIFQWSFDMEHNLMIIEPRYFEYLGIPTRDYTLTPEEFAFLIHPDDRKGVFDALALQLHGNLYERPVEYRLRRGDGKWEWFEAQSTYVGQLTDLPFRIIGICMSTQKYKDTENKLNEALQKAQRSDELKSVFLANMSHEIRTPLNAIVGFSTLLACGDADLSRQEIMEFTSLIEKNSQLLMVLISDILDLSKIESNTMEFHFEKVSLNGILESIYSAQKMNLRKGVELLLDLPDRAAVIYTDPTRLGQVVNNLINNAVKFTAEGRITIGYRLKDFATLEVFVEDTGTGMSEEVLAHIFERFYKGDAFVQGTGLGLAICRTIVERFHGKIEVASTLGKGSRFAIVLPQEMRE